MGKKTLPQLRFIEGNSREVVTQTDVPLAVHNCSQTERPRHRSIQVQTTANVNKKTQTDNDIDRPDRFDAEKVRTESQISSFETFYMSKYFIYT